MNMLGIREKGRVEKYLLSDDTSEARTNLAMPLKISAKAAVLSEKK